MEEIKGRSQIYGKAAIPLTKSFQDIYLTINEYPFRLKHVLVSWIRNPATTKDIYIEIENPNQLNNEAWQNKNIPIESITTPAAFGFLDHSTDIDFDYDPETVIHLLITGQDPNDPPVINITCLGIQAFTQEEIKYHIAGGTGLTKRRIIR